MINQQLAHNSKFTSLRNKGGMMFFTIQRPTRFYKGTILLTPVEDCHQKRAVYIREYRYTSSINDSNSTGGANETQES